MILGYISGDVCDDAWRCKQRGDLTSVKCIVGVLLVRVGGGARVLEGTTDLATPMYN